VGKMGILEQLAPRWQARGELARGELASKWRAGGELASEQASKRATKRAKGRPFGADERRQVAGGREKESRKGREGEAEGGGKSGRLMQIIANNCRRQQGACQPVL